MGYGDDTIDNDLLPFKHGQLTPRTEAEREDAMEEILKDMKERAELIVSVVDGGLAKDVLRLIEALEQCRRQRNISTLKAWESATAVISADDKTLLAILRKGTS